MVAIGNKKTLFHNSNSIESLSDDIISKILSHLSFEEICRFCSLNERFRQNKAFYLQNLHYIEIKCDNENISESLILISKYCKNVKKIRVFRFFHYYGDFVYKTAQILNNCPNLENFVTWLCKKTFSYLTKNRLALKKIFIDITNFDDFPLFLKLCPTLTEINLRASETYRMPPSAKTALKNLNTTLPSLKRLSLRSVFLDAAAKCNLAALKNLTHFEVISGGYDDIDVIRLVEKMPDLIHLGLCGNEISWLALLQISQHCVRLESLDIMVAGCDGCTASFSLLCSQGRFENLKMLYVQSWPLPWVEKFLRKKPNCSIVDFDTWQMSVE